MRGPVGSVSTQGPPPLLITGSWGTQSLQHSAFPPTPLFATICIYVEINKAYILSGFWGIATVIHVTTWLAVWEHWVGNWQMIDGGQGLACCYRRGKNLLQAEGARGKVPQLAGGRTLVFASCVARSHGVAYAHVVSKALPAWIMTQSNLGSCLPHQGALGSNSNA